MLLENTTLCHIAPHSDYSYMLFCQLIKGYLTLFCVILGTVGNLHGIKSIHLSNFDKNRGVVLAASIISLAFWDTILLWCAVFYYSIGALLRPYNLEMPTLIIPWFQGCAQISLTASVWCVAAITLQRWWASRDPFLGSRLGFLYIHFSSRFITCYHLAMKSNSKHEEKVNFRSSRVLLNTPRSERRKSSVSVIYCSIYRRHFRMPMILSSLAIIANLPAFFELTSINCLLEDGTYGTMLVYWLRGYDYYILWYRVVFRSIVATIGPNIFIFTITLWTVLLIRGSSRSRRRLFQMSDNVSDRYASKETIQTVISLMLATKFLLLRMPLFILDVLEVAGIWNGSFMYASDLSNFLVVANSATNCVIYLKAAKWLEHKMERRNTSVRNRCASEALQASRRIDLLKSSWSKVKRNNFGNFGARLVHAILSKHPNLYEMVVVSQINGSEESEEIIKKDLCENMLTSPRIQQLGRHVTLFIEQILDLMVNGRKEQEIAAKIRQAAITHSNRNIVFSSSVWREFKNTFLEHIEKCPFDSETKQRETVAAWNSFISLVIREMKNGFWQLDDGQPNSASTFRRCSVMFSVSE